MPSKPMVLFENLKKSKIKNVEKEIPIKKQKLDLGDILVKTAMESQMRIKHHLYPGFNACQTPLPDLNELQDFPNCVVTLPYPVHISSKHCERVDMCHRRTLAREAYRTRLFAGRTAYQTAMNKNRKLRAMQKKNIYHYSLFELAERLERNPDPYFNGSYDYFYTGGNLCVQPEQNLLVHVGGKKLKDLYISRFSKKKHIPETPLRNLYIGIDACTSAIFEVSPFRSSFENRTNCFLSRQRNCINLHSYRMEGKLKTITQFKSDASPFTSFAQSKNDNNQILISNMKQHVRIYDLETGKPTLSKLYDLGCGSSKNNLVQWNMIKPWRDHTYLYANFKELYLMDLRTSSKEWLKNACGFGENDFFCENITSLKQSEFDNLFYVGASHKLYCLDLRNWQNNFGNKNTVCRWFHQLEYPPLMIQNFRDNKSEFIALSSPVAGEMHICELMRGGKVKNIDEDGQLINKAYIYKSPSLPYQPTTLMEAYNHARINGKCLRPDADLKQRLNCCTTGLTYYMNPEHKYEQPLFLTSTSNGDVFGHKLSKRESQAHEPRTSAFTDEIVCKYEDRICELTQSTLNYTEVVDMKAMSKVFRCSVLSDLKAEKSDTLPLPNADSDDGNKDDTKKIKRSNNLGRWQKSMKVLHNYKDALAQDILSIWDIDYKDDLEDINLSNLPKSKQVKQESDDLVKNWLRTTDTQPPMIKIPLDNFEGSTANLSNVKIESIETPTTSHANVSIKLNTSSALLDESFDMKAFTTMADEMPQSTQLFENSTTLQTEKLEQSDLFSNTFNTSKNSTIKKKRNRYVKGF